MSDTVSKHCWLGLVLSLLLLSACTSAAKPPVGQAVLFSLQPAQSRQSLGDTPGANAYLRTLLDDPAMADIRLVDVNPQQVAASTQALVVPMPDGSEVRFELIRVDQSTPGMTGWIGDVPGQRKRRFTGASEVGMDPFSWVSLVREGDRVAGSLHVAGQAYRLLPIGAGKHVLVKVDESRLAPDVVEQATQPSAATRPGTAQASPSAHSTLRVLIVTTQQSRARVPDHRLLVAEALQLANQFMLNSKVDITFELAGFFDADYDETGMGYSEQLADLRLVDRPLGKAVYAQREALGAHLVSMLSSYNNVCGVARLTADKANAYSSFSCIGATLAHELGHNLGATHEWTGVEYPNGAPYMFGFKRTTAPALHTVMRGSHQAIPYFSNPRLQYQGVPIGTVEHEDVARRFNEYRAVVESFYPRSLTVSVYEHTNFEGRSCSFVLVGTSSAYVSRACGEQWRTMISSARILGITPGTRVYFSIPGSTGQENYQSVTYRGDLQIPAFGDNTAMPVGLYRARSGDPVNDKIDVIANWVNWPQ